MLKKRIVINSFFTTLAMLSFVNVVYSSEAGLVESGSSDFFEPIATHALTDLAKKAWQQDLTDNDSEKSLRHIMYFRSRMQAIDEDKQVKEEYEKHWGNFLQELKKMKGEVEETDFNFGMSVKLMKKIVLESPGTLLAKMLISSPEEEYEDPRPFQKGDSSLQTKKDLLSFINNYIRCFEEEDPASNFDKTKILLSRYRNFFSIDDEKQFLEKVESWAPRTPKDFLEAAAISGSLFGMTHQNGLLMSNDNMKNMPAKSLARPFGYSFFSVGPIEPGGSIDIDGTSGRVTVMSKEETAKNLASDVEGNLEDKIEGLLGKVKTE